MNNDAEAINHFLAWLLQEPDPASSAPSGDHSSQKTGPEESGAVDLQFPYLDPLDSEAGPGMPTELMESSAIPFEEISSFELGELPAVQDRFHALIKRRLRAEIERNPPLFPWETKLCDYESEVPDVASEPAALWATQLQALNLPIPVPEALLVQLFDQCRQVVQSSVKQGVKLVRVVETLFPNQPQTLNQLAGLVLAAPSRSGSLTHSRPTLPDSAQVPSHYNVATSTQQMALALIAARDLLDLMTLELSPEHPRITRQWLTSTGALTLEAEYDPDRHRVHIQGHFPCAGRLSWQDIPESAVAAAECSDAGELQVERYSLRPNETYLLDVQLNLPEPSVLTFAVQILSE
ncbi:MAG: hypothetical protein IGS50_13005 [Synechococcales cyanobacterium C42_A2020_086]|nr:hypothetical protein [Synechococcales cyanobacterium C42_A2020_086]